MLTKINVPIIDISTQTERHVIIARGTETAWNGHPSTVLMPDGKTIFCVWQGRRDGTRRHGAPVDYMKRSDNGGLSWSDYLKLPTNWRAIGRGSPLIHRLVDSKGQARLLVFCRDEKRTTFLQAVSEDDGQTWSDMHPIGLLNTNGTAISGWTAPITILPVKDHHGKEKHLMWYERSHDGKPTPGVIWQSASYDGGLTWWDSEPVVRKAGASEPAVIRSPNGHQLLMLIREQNREMNSLFSVSNDEGNTWSSPKQLPLALTGDRHLARYTPDGRLVVVFRPVPPGKQMNLKLFPESYFTAWVGQYEDITKGLEGQYLIRLLRSYRGGDHTYPGLEVLPDSTLVATTYIQYRSGSELQSIVCVRFQLHEFE